MSTHLGKSIRFVFRSIFVLSVVSTPLGMVRALKSASAAPALMQFTSSGHVLGFASDGVYVGSPSHALHVEFVGATRVQPRAVSTVAEEATAPPLQLVTYADLWPGITLTYRASGIYTTTYALAPGADVSDIRLLYNASPSLNEDGTLNMAFESGSLTETAPVAWQEIAGSRVPVRVAFRVQGQQVSFAVGAYDPRYALTIDPVLNWHTFLGSSGAEYAHGIAIDSAGNIFVVGLGDTTWGNPQRAYTTGSEPGYGDGLVAKLDPSGGYLWHTFLGGDGNDQATDIVLTSDNVYVVGYGNAAWTCLPPDTDCTVRPYSADDDTFVAQLDPVSGHLDWNTFLGATGNHDPAFGIAVDGSANIYVAGWSVAAWGCGSPSTCTTLPYQGWVDGFVAKLAPDGSLTWNSFLGTAAGRDAAQDIAVSADGSAIYVGGDSNATWGSPKRSFGSGYDAYVAKLGSDGSLTWSTFLGGAAPHDGIAGLVLASDGSIFVSGDSDATWGAPIRSYKDAGDVFAAKLASNGALLWNTFLGGANDDIAGGVAVDGNGNAYVAGSSYQQWGSPLVPAMGHDGFAAKLSPSGVLVAHIFLGGSDWDYAVGIALDTARNAYILGASDGTWGSPLTAFAGDPDMFVAKTDFGLYLKSKGGQDGWILESSETSTVGGTLDFAATSFKLGDALRDKQYRAILSFNTASLPDRARIESVTLKIKKAGLVGTDPFSVLGNLLADVRKGAFSNVGALQLGDFRASAHHSAVLSFTSSPVNDWYSASLPGGELYHINKTGLTQFRLRFARGDDDDRAADFLKFYSGNAGAANRPQLIVTFSLP